MKIINLIIIIISISLFTNFLKAQQMETRNKNLSLQEQSIISISALTAKGNLDKLKTALNIGLEAGLTVNEIKEILVHLYAYCGFPRSIRGLQTFMEVMEERKRKGLKDKVGKEASKIDETDSKYERGKNILVKLNQMPQSDILTGYSAFAPIIDIYLKEHLFADIFERDVLNYIQRELATISVITSIGKSEPMLKSHLTICMNLGLSPEQLYEFINVIKTTLGKKEAKSAKRVLNGIRILKINQSK